MAVPCLSPPSGEGPQAGTLPFSPPYDVGQGKETNSLSSSPPSSLSSSPFSLFPPTPHGVTPRVTSVISLIMNDDDEGSELGPNQTPPETSESTHEAEEMTWETISEVDRHCLCGDGGTKCDGMKSCGLERVTPPHDSMRGGDPDPEGVVPITPITHNPNPNPNPNPKYTSLGFVLGLLWGLWSLCERTTHKALSAVYLDSGCTRDMLGGEDCESTINVESELVRVDTAGGEREVHEVGDKCHAPGLSTHQGLMAPWLPFTLLSLTSRMREGWSFITKGIWGCLSSPSGESHYFRVDEEGLLRHTPNDKPPLSFWANNERALHSKPKPRGEHKVKYSAITMIAYAVTACLVRLACPTQALSPVGEVGVLVQGLASTLPLWHLISASQPSLLKGTLSNLCTSNRVGVYTSKVIEGTTNLATHCMQGHLPHCNTCPSCIRARLTTKPAKSTSPKDNIKCSNKGLVLGVDYIGPYDKDIDDNLWGMVGVEVAHTYYGCVTLSNDKEAPTSTQCLKHMRLELESMSSDNLKLRRVHHDVDGSFDGEFKQYLLDNTIVDTDTGGHRPNNNAHTERRNKKLKESFKAMLYNATGGIGVYNALWGRGIKHANYCVNRVPWNDGRVPYTLLTGEEYVFNPKRDMIFGQQVYYHVHKDARKDTWETPGREGIWVGVSDRITNGHIIVPITWNPSSNSYDLGNSIHTPHVKAPKLYFPLRMGPVHTSPLRPEEWDENLFYDGFMSPHYKVNEGEDYPEERVEDEDPLMVVKKIRGRKGKGNKLKYLVEWEGSNIHTWEPSRHLTKYGCGDMVLKGVQPCQ